MLRIAWFGEKIDQKNILNFFYPPLPQIFFWRKKNEKCLEFPDLARKLVGKIFWKFYPPPQDFFFLKKRKMIRISWFGEKIGRKNILKILKPPPRPLSAKQTK